MLVERFITVYEQIGMRQVSKHSGFHPFEYALFVHFEHFKRPGVHTEIRISLVRFVKMIAENHVIQPLAANRLPKPGHVFRKILALESDPDLNPIAVFLAQGAHARQIAGQFVEHHPHFRNKRRIVFPRRMVGKSEYSEPAGNGAQHVIFIAAHGMMATGGMGMIVRFQHDFVIGPPQ